MPSPSIELRAETPDDAAAIGQVNTAAFGGPAEGDLVADLRRQGAALVSLVAETGGQVVGHILFSPVEMEPPVPFRLAGLAPMAVLPEHQREGIGSLLVREGLQRCRDLGIQAVIVLGHPEYYPRFGFAPGREHGISTEYDVPAEVFMVLELEPGVLQGVRGIAHYHPAFSRL